MLARGRGTPMRWVAAAAELIDLSAETRHLNVLKHPPL